MRVVLNSFTWKQTSSPIKNALFLNSPISMLFCFTQLFTISSRVGPKSASCRYMVVHVKIKLATFFDTEDHVDKGNIH